MNDGCRIAPPLAQAKSGTTISPTPLCCAELDYFEWAPAASLLTNAEGKILRANRACRALMATEASGLLDRQLTDLFLESDARSLRTLAAGQSGAEQRLTLRLPAGHPCSVAASVTAMPAEPPAPQLYYWMLREIASGQEAESSQPRRQFEMIFEKAAIGIALVDCHTRRYVNVNPAFQQLLGYDAAELLNRRPEELTHIEDWELERPFLNELYMGQIDHYRIEKRYQRKDGIPVWARLTVSLVSDKAGRPDYSVAVVEDITILKQAEKALEDQLEFLQKLIDTIPSPIFYKDPRGRYLGCNKAFTDRLGLRKEEIIGKTVFDHFPQELAEKYHDMDQALFANPGEQSIDASVVFASGQYHDVIINKATFNNSDGTMAGLVAVTVDITERKRAEARLRKAHDELEQRVRERTAELARVVEELQVEVAERRRVEEALIESSEKLKLFAYSVAHDLKSPAVGLHGIARLLHQRYRDSLDAKGQTYCEQILRATEHVAALVDKINVFITTKEAPICLEPLQLREILQIVREEFEAQLSARHIAWIETVCDTTIRADRLSLLRVLRNLVDNALKYGGAELSTIRIGYRCTARHHELSVSDDGVGVPSEDSEKILRLFQRHETSKGTEGSGLGLAIVKEIAARHGGDLWVEPGEGRGTTFFVSIATEL